ncbi:MULTISPECIES: ABC transporter substrate-binding protein [Micrococcaceae]|uniref:ABC transporter substrate-binding protein n=1 Tax=Micrococcaceae TaxID=1268 RepID=UPI001957189B|nr:ABC transporter substrate-binding protein [Glutamicibacter protophormiae]QRQ78420.1 ABC transporter substrate-binding protein [Glutamicibacter protophormiae]
MVTKRRSARKALSALAVSALAIGSLAACGSSEEPSADGPVKLRVAVAPIQFETAYIAEEQGFFENQGLDVELVNGADPAALLAQVVSGDVNVAIGSWINVATSFSQGVPVQVIGGNGMVDPESDNSGVMVAKDSGIKELSGLKGKTIGVVGVKSGGDIPVLQALEAAGVPESEITEVAVPYAGMEAALEQGTVDAVVPADSFYHQMLEKGYKSISNPVQEFQSNMPVTVWTVQKQWLEQNSDTAKKFDAAMEEAVEFYSDPANLEEVRKVHAEANQIDVADAPTTFVPADVTFNVAEAQSGIDAMVHFGLIENKVAVEEVLWDEAPSRASADAK